MYPKLDPLDNLVAYGGVSLVFLSDLYVQFRLNCRVCATCIATLNYLYELPRPAMVVAKIFTLSDKMVNLPDLQMRNLDADMCLDQGPVPGTTPIAFHCYYYGPQVSEEA